MISIETIETNAKKSHDFQYNIKTIDRFLSKTMNLFNSITHKDSNNR
jgi:hypothetical protein